MKSFVSKDIKDHPECRYSMSSQKECSSTNGNFACETIRRVFRNCPGLRPEQVYDITTRDTGTVSKSPGEGTGGSGGGGGGGGVGGIDGGIPVFGGRASSQRPHGSFQRIIPPDDWPLGGKGTDDVLGSLHDRISSFFKDSPFPNADGDSFHGGRSGGDRSTEHPAWGSGPTTTPRVPPPHKVQQPQSQPRAAGEQPGPTGEAAEDGSVVARA
ncbi:unnamed protein product [Pylaiella littoralis]